MDFQVQAELLLRSHAALKGVEAIHRRLGDLRQMIAGTQSVADSMVARLALFGGAYLGVRAVTSAVRSLASEGMSFATSMETMSVGLTTVMSAVEGVSMESAATKSAEAFANLQRQAVESTATTQQLFEIFQGIYGPIRAAGFALSDVEKMTSETVSAASALGVDFAQATRDINQMVQGAAGVDVKLFRSMRSMGLIAEDAQAFNQLTATERITRLQSALSNFTESGKAYAKTWAGVTSTFMDIVQMSSGAAIGPTLNRVKASLGQINTVLIANQDRIMDGARRFGERVGYEIGYVLYRAGQAISYVSEHWTEITAKINTITRRVKEMMPQLMQAAKLFAAVSVGRQVAGAAIGAAQILPGAISAVGAFLPAAGAAGGAAAGAGGAAAGAAGAAGGAAAGLSSMGAAATVLGAAMVVLAPLTTFLAEEWKEVAIVLELLKPSVMAIFEDFKAIAQNLWTFVAPGLKLVGGIMAGAFLTALSGLVAVFRVGVGILRIFSNVLAWVGKSFKEYVADPIVSFIMWIAQHVASLTSQFTGNTATPTAPGSDERANANMDNVMAELERQATESLSQYNARAGLSAAETRRGPNVVHNDFRGSRNTIKQEFRDADPDRVAADMINDMARFAEQRIESGFAPALTR